MHHFWRVIQQNQANKDLANIGDKIDEIKENQLDINDDISTTQNSIEETQKELDAAQEELDKQYDAMVTNP